MSTTTKYSRLAPGQRREQILDAANALFAERGYDEVSVEDIASSAGVTRGLVHHYFGGRKQVYIALLERLGTMREEQLPPPVGRSARARVADSVSRWLDWTEQNRTIWLATLGRGEDIADPDIRAVVLDLVRRAVAIVAAHHADIADDIAAAALRARMLDRPQPRRHPTLATRRSQPRADPRTARHNTRTRPTHVRQTTRAKPVGRLAPYPDSGSPLPWRARQGRPWGCPGPAELAPTVAATSCAQIPAIAFRPRR